MLASDLAHALIRAGVTSFFGVPDSVLAPFTDTLEDDRRRVAHTICANEGGAVSQALGTYLASGTVAAAYMQNSGLGNALNPIISMASAEVGSIPTLLVIGWRGEPGRSDEPQHVLQGRITLPLLDLLDVPHWVLDRNSHIDSAVAAALKTAMDRRAPVALVVKHVDKPSRKEAPALPASENCFSRRRVLAEVFASAPNDAAFVLTTGYTAREANELLLQAGAAERALYVVGAMGHASQIAAGISKQQPNRPIVCVDGDGAMLMHLGNLADVAKMDSCKFIHVVISNGTHDSVGGQPIAGKNLSLSSVARTLGYTAVSEARSAHEIRSGIKRSCELQSPSFIEALVARTAVGDLARPRVAPRESTAAFEDYLRIARPERSTSVV